MVSERFGRVSMSNTPKHQAESGSSRQHKRNLRAIRARPCHIRRPLMRGCASSASHLNMSRRIAMDLRSGLRTKGTITDYVSFIDESFLVNFSPNTWWFDSGATVHISNSLQVFSSIQTIREGERSLRVADGNEVKVEGIGNSKSSVS